MQGDLVLQIGQHFAKVLIYVCAQNRMNCYFFDRAMQGNLSIWDKGTTGKTDSSTEMERLLA